MLSKVDQTLLTRQKSHLYRNGNCPRLVWDMTITDPPISWIERSLESIATRFLKRWTGLAHCANINQLYLPKSSGGLQLPSVSGIYKKARCRLTASHTLSKDSTVHLLASRQTLAETSSIRAAFKPHQEEVEVMKQDPGASRKQLIKKVRQRITNMEHSRRLKECRQLPVQGDIAHRFDDQSSSIWAETIWSLPEKVMKFALKAIQDTFPHKSNLHLWRKKPSSECPLRSERQTLLHVLNHCPVALKKRKYNHHHDAILNLLYQFTCSHISPLQRFTVDLPGVVYSPPLPLPPTSACTDSRPDLEI